MGEGKGNYLRSSLFPKGKTIKIQSPETERYNCVAWVLGQTDIWYEPDEDYRWPEHLPLNDELDTMRAFFEYFGYRVCANEKYEIGYQKIALFTQSNAFTHVARQESDGQWTSKLGVSYDVAHRLQELSGGMYGELAVLMKKRWDD